MSRTSKIIIGVVVGLTCLCLCSLVILFPLGLAGRFAYSHVVTQSSEVTQVARQIAEYKLPADYTQEFAVNVAGLSLVSYGSPTGRGHLMLMQIPGYVKLDASMMERQMWSLASGHRSRVTFNLHTVDKMRVTVRGQEITLDVSEGTTTAGELYRQVAGLFEGEGGQTFLLAGAPVSEWDQKAFDEFIGSIR